MSCQLGCRFAGTARLPVSVVWLYDVLSLLRAQDWMTPNVGVHPSAYDAFADDAEKFHLVVKCARRPCCSIDRPFSCLAVQSNAEPLGCPQQHDICGAGLLIEYRILLPGPCVAVRHVPACCDI